MAEDKDLRGNIHVSLSPEQRQKERELLVRLKASREAIKSRVGNDPNAFRVNRYLSDEFNPVSSGGMNQPEAYLSKLEQYVSQNEQASKDPNLLSAGAPSKGSGIGRVFSDLGSSIASGAQNAYDEGARPVAGAVAGGAGGFITGGPAGAFAGGAMGLRNGLVNDAPITAGGLGSSLGQGAAAGGALRGLEAISAATNTAPASGVFSGNGAPALGGPATAAPIPSDSVMRTAVMPDQSPFSIGFRNPITTNGSLPSLGKLGLPAGLTLPKLGSLFSGGNKPSAPSRDSSGGEPSARNPGVFSDVNVLPALVGGGLLAGGLLAGEDGPQNYAAPTALDPAEQSQLDALTKQSNELYGRASSDLASGAAQGEADYARQLAAINEPLLQEELRRAREAAGSKGLGSSGIEGSGAIGEAFARQAAQRNAGYQNQAANVFAPSRINALNLRTQGTLNPLGYSEGGAQRLFGLRDIADERNFASQQDYLNRKSQRNRALIGAGSQFLSQGFAGRPSGGRGVFGSMIPRVS